MSTHAESADRISAGLDPIVSIPVEDIRKVLPFMARGDIRYYLNGIYVEPYNGGCLLVCTNGHVMGVIESKAARCDQVRIIAASNPDFVAALSRLARLPESEPWDDEDEELPETPRPAYSSKLIIENAMARAVIQDKDGVEEYVLPGKPFIDGKYPEWRKVMPRVEDLEAGLTDAISTHYLAYLKRVFSGTTRETQVVFYRDKAHADKAAVARFDAMHELVVLIMPMRRDHPLEGWPDWIQPTVITEAAT